ncbi:uncharacterized protein LOC110749738 [Prunus avium]|uniref:Uncharacterized protein LOC110749738 n=1 Tax=Prunus avium TaxID=42229 RepID=A0A6P5RL41_PRUAV|nr:uncharacterized protein LOC110749738 [Prunus avium]
MPSLADLIRSNDVVWKDNRVVYKYRRIIRDIIELFAEFMLYDQYCHWDIRHINIVDDRVRKDSILNPDSGPIMRRKCKTQFISMVRDILGNDNNKRELNHFYKMANHGLQHVPKWKEDYTTSYSRFINIRENLDKSNYSWAFQEIYEDKTYGHVNYGDDVVGLLAYSNYVINHIGEKLALKTHEVEEELTSMFPERLTDLYDFFVKKSISMRFLAR